MIFALGVVGWRIVAGLGEPLGKETSSPIRSIAVLPLDNLSGDPEQDYFSDGMTEALISELAQIRSLRVKSRTSVMRYKSTRMSLPEIAEELEVEGVVEGSVLRDGDRIRITLQLIDARTDNHLWAQSYERDLRDVLKLQGEVARTVARQVTTPISSSRPSPCHCPTTHSSATTSGWSRS